MLFLLGRVEVQHFFRGKTCQKLGEFIVHVACLESHSVKTLDKRNIISAKYQMCFSRKGWYSIITLEPRTTWLQRPKTFFPDDAAAAVRRKQTKSPRHHHLPHMLPHAGSQT